jgi:hypothetical protein
MISHDVLISAKVALLETVLKDLLADRFLETANPLQALEQYAETRTRRPPPSPENADYDLAGESIWNEFFDDIRRRIVSGLSERSR